MSSSSIFLTSPNRSNNPAMACSSGVEPNQTSALLLYQQGNDGFEIRTAIGGVENPRPPPWRVSPLPARLDSLE
jgi:hypothetical protein